MGQHQGRPRDKTGQSERLNQNDSKQGGSEDMKSVSEIDQARPSTSNSSQRISTKIKSWTSFLGRGVNGSRNDERTETLLPLLHHDAFLQVLTFVPGIDLVRNCRLVNKDWKEAIDASHIWVNKLQQERNERRPMEVDLLKQYEGVDIKKLYIKGTFRKNLIKNWEGSDKFKFWKVLSNGGDGFQLEPAGQPYGSKPLPAKLGCVNCWATSYRDCIARQIVDLGACGCDQVWFDEIQPPIKVSEWIANRYDCAAVYTLTVMLCDKNKKPLKGEKFRHNYERRTSQWADNGWEKHKFTFKHYGPGVRYVLFQHKGIDGQFWAGHYGPKMAAPCVRILPRTTLKQLDK